MMERMKGRPQSMDNREERERRVYDLLDKLGIAYERVDHAPADTMEACLAVDEALGTQMCKNLFLCNRQKTEFYLLMMPGSKSFKTSIVSSQIGSSRLSFGTPEDLERLLDLTPGSVSILGLVYDKENKVKLLVDEDVLAGSYVGCHPCINTTSLRIKTEDLRDKIIPALGNSMQTVILP